MTTYFIEATYSTCTRAKVEMPGGKTWADVGDWYVKWDHLYVRFNGEEEYAEIQLLSSDQDTDYKRPDNVTVYPADEDGECDYATEVAQQ